MTDTTQRLAAALAAILLATGSLTAVVTVPPAGDVQIAASVATPEIA